MGTLYRHFPTKEELVDAVLEDTFAELVAAAGEAAAAEDAWSGFAGFLERVFALHAANRGLKDVLAARGQGSGRAEAMRAQIRPLLRRLIERAQRAGHAPRRTSRPRTAAPLLVGRARDRRDRAGRARRLAPLSRAAARRAPRRGCDAASRPAAHPGAASARRAEEERMNTVARRRAAGRPGAVDGLRGADARHVPGRARPDDRLDRAADDRRRPRRPQPPLLGRHLVPARLDRLDADLRQARRHARAQARLPRRDPDLPRRLDARRALARRWAS